MTAQARQLGLFDTAEPAPAADSGSAPGLRLYDDGRHRFAYALRRASRRSIGIRVGDEGVVVSIPRWSTLAQLRPVLEDKAGWIARQLAARDQRRREQEAARIDWREGGCLPFLGASLTLRLGAGASGRDGDALRLALPHDSAPERIRDAAQAWMQREAQALFESRTAHFAARLGVEVRAVRLSSARGRWGSATTSGTVRLHWRLLHFAPAVVDYVVAHEIAHLREMNHGPRFWATVGELFPDWRDVRQKLGRATLPPW